MKFGNTNYENMSNASLILKWHLALKKNIYEEKLFYLYGWNDFEMCMAVEYIVRVKLVETVPPRQLAYQSSAV